MWISQEVMFVSRFGLLSKTACVFVCCAVCSTERWGQGQKIEVVSMGGEHEKL